MTEQQYWETFLHIMFTEWTHDEMAYAHIVQQQAIYDIEDGHA